MTKMCLPVLGALPCNPANPFRTAGKWERDRSERTSTLCANDHLYTLQKGGAKKDDRILIPSSSPRRPHAVLPYAAVWSHTLETLTLTWWPEHLLEFGEFRTLVLWGIKDSGHAIEILVL